MKTVMVLIHDDASQEARLQCALDIVRGVIHHPRLLAGGIIVGDDYHDAGVRRAFESYFAGRPDTLIAYPWGQAVVVRSAG